ncbi:MAG: hypothetical protein HRU19_09115 [Pseudobacteriovorax sp.]|nr:hypothetical protein [Pseudobacteriovorax sp.]
MKISLVQLKTSKIPLTQPYKHLDDLHRDRVVHLVTANVSGLGDFKAEISPFPGINSESSEMARTQINRIFASFHEWEPIETWDLSRPFFGAFSYPEVYDSVRGGFEQLLFEAYLAARSQPKTYKFSMAGLLTLSENYSDTIESQLASGLRCFKIKVGRFDSDTELRALEGIVRQCPDDSIFRFDANLQLSLRQLTPYLELIPRHRLSYVEEPKNPQVNPTGVSIAFDESQWIAPNLLPKKQDFLIVKIQRMPYSRVFSWLKRGQLRSDQIVLSSCFDTSVGLLSYLKFARYIGISQAHGFGPYRSLMGDADSQRLDLETLSKTGVSL